ncbi:hypothetical protein SUN_2241 [Sulfurovum sp. NBC37-1]|nr:hypothetical protein SUN_2241 [Sulfurovum sp. NBC37-1]
MYPMWKILIFLFLFLLSGCSINSLTMWGELDKVHVVKSTPYVKHYRAYFQRTDLHTIQKSKKYLFFYNKHTKDLAILLHPTYKYVLYSFSHPNLVIKINSDRKHGYRHMLKILKRKGYRVISPHSVGYTTHIALRRYKKVKTILVEVKDYQHLQSLYKKAIRTYNAKGIKHIQTRLPKVLIDSYYTKYKAQATTWEQSEQVEIIASKLRLNEPIPEKEEISQKKEVEAKITTDIEENNTEQLYTYYLKNASYYELNNFLSSSEARSTFSTTQYNNLKIRNQRLEEKNLLENGSLEELITTYKKDKSPIYKQKIMQRIKEIQQNE